MPDEENLPEPLSETQEELVCETCFNDNLLKAVGVLKCEKCDKIFCIHFASRIDPRYCVNCMSDASLTVEEIRVIRERYDEQKDKVIKYIRKATKYTIDGNDWMFAQRRIKQLTDPELELALEFHRGLCSLILQEAEARKAEKKHKLAGVKVIHNPIGSTTVTSSTTTHKTVKTSSTKQSAAVSALYQMMLAKGLTPEQIATMVKGMTAK